MNTVRDNLMYCDLVSRNGIIHKVGVDGNCFRIVDAEGIPITPEILEKNGWWYDEANMWLHDKVDFGIERRNGGLQCYNIDQIKLDSVHELQRALRCCGLWDIADNFKI